MATLQTNTAYRMGERYGRHPDDGKYPGTLIIVEGIDGSGKSTQIDLLQKWLNSRNLVTAFTQWNSSPIVCPAHPPSKQRWGGCSLPCPSASFTRPISPTGFTRRFCRPFGRGPLFWPTAMFTPPSPGDAARGVNRDWLRRIYSFAVEPTLALYFKVPLDVSIHRINTGREKLGYYESGQDMGYSNDREESFRIFQGKLLEEYEAMTEEFGMMTIDATQPIAVQQQLVRRYVEPLIENGDAGTRAKRAGGFGQRWPDRTLCNTAGSAQTDRTGHRRPVGHGCVLPGQRYWESNDDYIHFLRPHSPRE